MLGGAVVGVVAARPVVVLAAVVMVVCLMGVRAVERTSSGQMDRNR
jgi:hypothetical protein